MMHAQENYTVLLWTVMLSFQVCMKVVFHTEQNKWKKVYFCETRRISPNTSDNACCKRKKINGGMNIDDWS